MVDHPPATPHSSGAHHHRVQQGATTPGVLLVLLVVLRALHQPHSLLLGTPLLTTHPLLGKEQQHPAQLVPMQCERGMERNGEQT